MPLFGGKHKTPHELVKIVHDGLVVLSSADVKDEKKIQKVAHLYNICVSYSSATLRYFQLVCKRKFIK